MHRLTGQLQLGLQHDAGNIGVVLYLRRLDSAVERRCRSTDDRFREAMNQGTGC